MKKVTKIKLGLRVMGTDTEGEDFVGTVIHIESPTRAGILRDDGKEGSSINNSWAVTKEFGHWGSDGGEGQLYIYSIDNWRDEL